MKLRTNLVFCAISVGLLFGPRIAENINVDISFISGLTGSYMVILPFFMLIGPGVFLISLWRVVAIKLFFVDEKTARDSYSGNLSGILIEDFHVNRR